MSVLILGLVFAGCSVLNNSGVVPTSETDSVSSLIKASAVDPVVYPLYADKDWEVGEVRVWDDGEELCIKYQLNQDILDEGWLITKTHLAVAISKDGIPHNKQGIVQPGQFLYGDDDLAGVEYYQECIPFTELVGGGDTMFIAAHAIIEKPQGKKKVLSKTAWGAEESGGTLFVPKGDWATYFNYAIEEPGPFTVTYDGNTNTGGTAPVDVSSPYVQGATVAVLGQGDLIKNGYTFSGWNTAANGSGTGRAPVSTFTMGTANVILYAQWTLIPTYTVTFDKDDSDATGTMADQTIASGASAVLTANAFSWVGHTFAGWAETSGGTVAYADTASYTMGTANVTLYAKWAPVVVGDSYGGGIVAYFFQDNGTDPDDPGYVEGEQHGLIAAVADQSTGIPWWNGSNVETGATGTAIGTGQANTTAIVNTQGAGSYAAQLCNDLTEGGYNDWFLPSKDELHKLCINKLAIGAFDDYFYWSSSEKDAHSAWGQLFTDGTQFDHDKHLAFKVRAVRAF